MTRTNRTVLVAALVLATTALASFARADSIYLKNGRVIHSSDVRVEGDRVLFLQYGSMQTIPLALVDRVEKNDRGARGGRSATTPSLAAGSSNIATTPGATSSAPVDGGATGTPAARMQALTGFLGQSGGASVDATKALGLLQSLGASGGSGLDDIAGQLGALGALGGELGALGADMEKAQTLLPLLAQLGAALFAPEYSQDATSAAAQNLLSGLSGMGVSQQQIEAEARRLGVPPEVLEQLRRR